MRSHVTFMITYYILKSLLCEPDTLQIFDVTRSETYNFKYICFIQNTTVKVKSNARNISQTIKLKIVTRDL